MQKPGFRLVKQPQPPANAVRAEAVQQHPGSPGTLPSMTSLLAILYFLSGKFHQYVEGVMDGNNVKQYSESAETHLTIY